MLSGPLQGQMLRLLSQLLQPRTILEIGTFTGYSALCLAEGLAPDGKLYTIEGNPELEYLIRKYIQKAEQTEKIELIIGDAKAIIPDLPYEYDLVFIDAGKNDYAFYFDLVVDRVRPGGLILADNVLWSGKVLNGKYDKDTATIHAFNQKIQDDERVENILLPIRDGLIIARKR